MPSLKLTIGRSRKIGQPNFGSIGASVSVEVVVDQVAGPEELQQHVRELFGVVRDALNHELQGTNGHAANNTASPSTKAPATNGNGHSAPPSNGSSRAATQSQARAIRAIASRQRINVAAFLQSRFGVDRAELLSIKEASSVIDELKSADADKRRQ